MEDLGPRGAQVGLAREQPGAQRREVPRQPGRVEARAEGVAQLEGRVPVSAAWSSTPTLYQSAGGPAERPAACSGAMKLAVPTLRSSCSPRPTSSGQPEVEDHDAPLRRDQHVGGLHVAVYPTCPVDRRDPPRELEERGPEARLLEARAGWAGGHGGSSLIVTAGPDVLEEIDAVDELHREEERLVLLDQRVDAHDVGVDDGGERAELALEADAERRACPPGARFSATRVPRSRSIAS